MKLNVYTELDCLFIIFDVAVFLMINIEDNAKCIFIFYNCRSESQFCFPGVNNQLKKQLAKRNIKTAQFCEKF